jgi:pimeloyl-ACP methyl ester carboxylesterase
LAKLERPDGVEIHYDVAGDDGPAVVLAAYWTWNPGVYAELLADLARDHRVHTYHLRGTGSSTRSGPYDKDIDCGDLEAVLEAAGGNALVFSTADGSNRAVRVGARRPDLAATVISFGVAPISRGQFAGREAMLASDEVVEAFIATFERSYRTGLRALIEATNPQMDEEELRERIDLQAEFCPQEAAVGRLRAWTEDDPHADARELGERLWVLGSRDVAGPWLPPNDELERMMRQNLPDARSQQIETGAVTDPGDVAAWMRQVSDPLRERAARP